MEFCTHVIESKNKFILYCDRGILEIRGGFTFLLSLISQENLELGKESMINNYDQRRSRGCVRITIIMCCRDKRISLSI